MISASLNLFSKFTPVKLPKELESLFLAYRTIIYTIRQASGIRLLNNTSLILAAQMTLAHIWIAFFE
jgi:hypothetical protein